jgi:hypothetical protein
LVDCLVRRVVEHELGTAFTQSKVHSFAVLMSIDFIIFE